MIRSEKTFFSWGGRTSAGSSAAEFSWRGEPLPSTRPRLAYGMGRSYGDSCLIDDGCTIEMRRLDHLLAFDVTTGVIRCEAGCTVAQLLEICVPLGWFVPVTPGTKFVTLGGCVANDIHGKNHHRVGTFGCFVSKFALLRSDGIVRECSSEKNVELYSATIGGLGLTGFILWIELRLRKIQSARIQQHVETVHGIETFFDVAERGELNYEHSVAWLDTTHIKKTRGIFIAGNHDEERDLPSGYDSNPRVSVPLTLPDFVLGAWSIRGLNTAYYSMNALRQGDRRVFFDSFFYPLDSVGHWNRAYGRNGLVQYQFVVPIKYGPEVLREALGRVQAAHQASFLTVVKVFGNVRSPGMISFPRPGVTICFDFPHRGAATERLLDELDHTVFSAEGALYPAKDARMCQESFEKSFSRHAEFKRWIDPACSSNFARRTGLTA